MTIYYKIYLSLITVTTVTAVVALNNKHKKALYILLVMIATLAVEGYSTIAYAHRQDFSWIYHLFCPVEYTFFCLYYIKSCPQNAFKPVATYSIPVFITFSLCVSYFLYQFRNMPALNINIEGLFLFLFYTHLLFCMNVPLRKRIWQHPDFWLSIGMLVFYGGVFVFLGLYPYLFGVSPMATIQLFDLITKPLNIFFYTFIIAGLICLIRSNRYFI